MEKFSCFDGLFWDQLNSHKEFRWILKLSTTRYDTIRYDTMMMILNVCAIKNEKIWVEFYEL